MPTVAILGAGELGGALAYTLARRAWPGQIALIDETAGTSASGKALDIMQSAPVEGSDTTLVGTDDLDRVAGAGIAVVADRLVGGEWTGDPGLKLVTRVAALAPRAILVLAGAAHAPLMELAARELGVDRRRLIGPAPASLEAAARALCAAEMNAAAPEISLCLVGVPPRQFSIVWSSATIHGQAISGFLGPHQIARIDARVPALWPPGPNALASASSRVCEALARGSRRLHTAFVVLDGELGARGRAVALPLRIGVRGVSEIAVPHLSTHERVKLENALQSA